MFESMTYEAVLGWMLSRVPDKFDKREGSVIWDTHSPTAIEFQILYIELEALIANSYGDTAAREFLVLLCKDRGIAPKAATNAILKGEFVPATIDVAGQRFNIGDVNYVVTEMITPGTYQVECETPGVAGNQLLGQMVPMEYIGGLQAATLTEILVPGEDDEDTEALRERYFASLGGQAFGGNRADYLSKVRGMDGIGGVKVTCAWNGGIRPADMVPTDAVARWYGSVIGTLDGEAAHWLSSVYGAAAGKRLAVGGAVLITVTDSDDYGEASGELVRMVQEALDPEQNAGEGYGLAPIGHVVRVRSAEAVSVHVSATVEFEEGYGWANLQPPIQEAVGAYLLELRKKWPETTSTTVRASQVESRILSVKGVADVSGTRINGAEGNLALAEHEVPVIGGVSP